MSTIKRRHAACAAACRNLTHAPIHACEGAALQSRISHRTGHARCHHGGVTSDTIGRRAPGARGRGRAPAARAVNTIRYPARDARFRRRC